MIQNPQTNHIKISSIAMDSIKNNKVERDNLVREAVNVLRLKGEGINSKNVLTEIYTIELLNKVVPHKIQEYEKQFGQQLTDNYSNYKQHVKYADLYGSLNISDELQGNAFRNSISLGTSVNIDGYKSVNFN